MLKLCARYLATAAFAVAMTQGPSAAAQQGNQPTDTPEPPRCVAGEFVEAPTAPGDTPNLALPAQEQSAHFVMHYKKGVVSASDVQAGFRLLEALRSFYINHIGFLEPDCLSATKRKANIYVGEGYGLSGGADGTHNMAMWMGPGGLLNRFGLAHELAHAFQGSSGGNQETPFGGWMWEMHANFMALQLPEFRNDVHCGALSVNYPHMYYGSTRVRYCNTQFFEYIKNHYGYKVINDIWRRSPKTNADPLLTLQKIMNWSLDQMNDTFGDWALHNVNWDYTDPDGTDHGAVYREKFGANDVDRDDALLRLTTLDPIDLPARRFAVPFAWAPQRWGYNLVKLVPDRGAKRVTVTFRGVTQAASAVSDLPGLANEPATIPPPASGWRWGLVAISADGKSRYGAMQKGPDGQASIDVKSGDTGLYMVVLGAPTEFQQIVWDQKWYSLYRFPWMAQFDGAMPNGFQDGAPSPRPDMKRHPNGGGWVAKSASVAKSAYVGPYARVYGGSVKGNARLEDHATVISGEVADNGRLSAMSILRGNTIVKDNAQVANTFIGLGEFENGIVLSGTAQTAGDVEERGASLDHGVFYGFVDSNVAKLPEHGANLTALVPEVTAKPNYTWRP